MRFDQTSIAIRERSSLEVFDLAANVLVQHFRPIILLLFLKRDPVCTARLLPAWLDDRRVI